MTETEVIYVLEEKGPDGIIKMLFNTRGKAEEELERSKKFWDHSAEKNKSPKRTYIIKRYIFDE